MKLNRFLCLTLAFLLCVISVPAFAADVTTSATPSSMATAGEAVIEITVSNDGSAAMEQIQISSAYSGIFFDTQGASIAPGKSQSFSCSLAVGDALLGTAIPFDITWLENGVQKSASSSVTIERQIAASLSVSRVTSSTQASPGDEVALTYTITNTGGTAVTVNSLVDSEIAGSKPIASNFTIPVSSSTDFIYTYKMGYNTVVSQPVVTYLDSNDQTQTATASAVTLGMVNSKISVEVVQGTPTADGVPFNINLTNNGNQKISSISITDDLGKKVNDSSFALAVGESRQLSYTILTDETRYVVFYIKGKSSSGDTYEDNTKSYVVRKYIDPSLLGIEFSATVTESLNVAGSIKINFVVNNTGTLDMSNLVISEQTVEKAEDGTETQKLTEIHRADTVVPGTYSTEQTVYVGDPRDLTFVVSMDDPAGNPYTYTAYVTADFVGVYDASQSAATQQNVIDTLGATIGSSVNSALTMALVILAILTVIAVVALLILTHLEKQQRIEAARRRAKKARRMRAIAEANASNRPDLKNTQIQRRRDN